MMYGGNNDGFATIEENVVLVAGARILSKVTIGLDSVVGANVVVIQNILENSIVVSSAKIKIRNKNDNN